MRNIFIGSNGIRAGWRLLIYVALFAGIAWILQLAGERVWHLHRPTGPMTPVFTVVADLFLLVPLLIAAFIMSRIERRSLGDYGLPLQSAALSRVFVGAVVGFISLSLLLGIILATGGVHFAIAQLTPGVAVDGIVFVVGFVLVGLAEEFLFRGYTQYTLAQGIGFWPAGIVLSLLFAFAHVHNAGESLLGLVQVIVAGLVLCFVLKVTGNLWFAVGYHAAWDWSETFFYGVPDSGLQSASSFLHGTMLGPTWLSGGSDGPEASFLATMILLALIPLVWYLYGRAAGVSIQER